MRFLSYNVAKGIVLSCRTLGEVVPCRLDIFDPRNKKHRLLSEEAGVMSDLGYQQLILKKSLFPMPLPTSELHI